MKFLSELGSCYRPAPPDTAGDRSSAAAATPSRGGHWRPNLSAISEDGVVLTERRSPPREKKKSPPGRGGSAAKPRRHNYNNNQRDSIQVVVPMFAPTPFVL